MSTYFGKQKAYFTVSAHDGISCLISQERSKKYFAHINHTVTILHREGIFCFISRGNNISFSFVGLDKSVNVNAIFSIFKRTLPVFFAKSAMKKKIVSFVINLEVSII